MTGAVQSAQGGVELGNCSNRFDAYINTLNLAGTIAGASPFGVGLDAAAAVTGTAVLTKNFMRCSI